MKKILFAFLIIFFAGFAQALSLNAPSEIPSNVNWSFTAEFSAIDFTEAKFFLDDSALTTVYVYNGSLFVAPNSTNQNIAMSVLPSGNKVSVSMIGLAKGQYSLKAEVFKNTEKTDSNAVTINVSEALSSGSKEELEKRVDSAQATINSIASELNAIKTIIEELKNSLNSIQASNSGLEQKVSETKTILDQFAEKTNNIDGEINLVNSDIQELRQGSIEPEKPKSLLESIFQGKTTEQAQTNANEENENTAEETSSAPAPLLPLAQSPIVIWGLAIIIIIVVAFVGIKIAREKGISLGKFEFGKSSFDETEVMNAREIHASIEDQRSGKWAFEQRPVQKEKKFSFGQLLKRR